MRKARTIVTPLLLSLGLAACGQNATTAQNAATGQPMEETATTTAQDAAITETAAVANEAAPDRAAAAATVTALPLKRGYYVSSDTPCGQSSNATTSLLRRDGIGGSRSFCEFRKIEKTGPSLYRVTEACGDLQDDAPPDVGVTIYTLTGDTAFTSKSASGWVHSARYCRQSSMSPDFRENDIGDLID